MYSPEELMYLFNYYDEPIKYVAYSTDGTKYHASYEYEFSEHIYANSEHIIKIKVDESCFFDLTKLPNLKTVVITSDDYVLCSNIGSVHLDQVKFTVRKVDGNIKEFIEKIRARSIDMSLRLDYDAIDELMIPDTIEELIISNRKQFRSWKFLDRLVNLKSLDISNARCASLYLPDVTRLTKLTFDNFFERPKTGFANLEQISIIADHAFSCNIKKLLHDAKALKVLKVDCKEGDFRGLSKLKKLECLSICTSKTQFVNDVEKCTKLKELKIICCDIGSLDFVNKMKGLEKLAAHYCCIETLEISPQSCIKTIHLKGNHIKNIVSLPGGLQSLSIRRNFGRIDKINISPTCFCVPIDSDN